MNLKGGERLVCGPLHAQSPEIQTVEAMLGIFVRQRFCVSVPHLRVAAHAPSPFNLKSVCSASLSNGDAALFVHTATAS